MIQEATYDQVVALVRLRARVAVLLYLEEDPLSTRSLSAFELLESKLRSHGYYTFSLAVDHRSSHYEETSCVRVPQLRLFDRGRCRTKLTGLLSFDELNSIVSDKLS